MAAVGKFVLWGKENLCLIRPLGESLVLETLFFAEDVRVKTEIEEAVAEADVKDAELDLARQVIESISGEFDPEEFRNEYRDDLRRMLDAKVAGQEITKPAPAPETPVIDLMEALKASVAETKKPTKKAAAAGPKRRRAPAKAKSA